jgi:sRNA-binding carbon storage regulator CsrA
MMYVDLKINDTIKIGDIVIKLLDKSGRLARIAVDAPPSQPVTVNKAPKATHDQRA